MSTSAKVIARQKRKKRIRAKMLGTSEKPRLVVFRSLNNIQSQLVDDIEQKTILSASTLGKSIKGEIKNKSNIEAAKIIGELIAKKAAKAGIKEVVFDRGGYLFHGRVKALAEAARKGGLKF